MTHFNDAYIEHMNSLPPDEWNEMEEWESAMEEFIEYAQRKEDENEK